MCRQVNHLWKKYVYFTYMILSGSINFETALENVKTRKLFMLHSVFLFLMICWTFGSWCRVQIFKRQNSVNLWKYRYRLYFFNDVSLSSFWIHLWILFVSSDITWWRSTRRLGLTSLWLVFTLSRPWRSTPCSPHSALGDPSCCTSSWSASPPSSRTSPSQPTGFAPPTSTLTSSGPRSTCSTGLRGTRKLFILLATFGLALEEI